MAVNLTSGAIGKISTGRCTSNNLKPVVQVTYIHNLLAISDDEQWHWVRLSDGSFYQNGRIRVEAVRLNQLQEGSIVQLNDFVTYTIRKITVFLVNDLNLIHRECDFIGNPEPFPHNDTPLVERSTSPIPDEDPVDVIHAQESVTSTQKCVETQSRKRKHQSSNETLVLEKSKPTIIVLDNSECDTNEDVDNGHRAQEPLATTQSSSSHSLTQRKKQKCQSRNDNISKVLEDVSKLTKLMLEKNNEDDVGACIKKLEILEKDVTIMTKMMIEKNKEDDVGACLKKLEVFEDLSKMMRMILEKNKENDVGACFKKLETLEEDVSKLTRMMMEKNKEDVVGFKQLEILEDVSKMTKIMMDKNKEDDTGACFDKLETLEEDVSIMKKMMMEKNKDDDVRACFEKLKILEEDVSKLTRMMMEKNKDDDVRACFEKLKILEEDVSKLTRMMMEKNKEDDVGACIEKLDKMGWGREEPIYDTALLLFGQSSDYRKLWLHLKLESCGKWVKNAGSMFGLLD